MIRVDPSLLGESRVTMPLIAISQIIDVCFSWIEPYTIIFAGCIQEQFLDETAIQIFLYGWIISSQNFFYRKSMLANRLLWHWALLLCIWYAEKNWKFRNEKMDVENQWSYIFSPCIWLMNLFFLGGQWKDQRYCIQNFAHLRLCNWKKN